jgi:hypothetical protein
MSPSKLMITFFGITVIFISQIMAKEEAMVCLNLNFLIKGYSLQKKNKFNMLGGNQLTKSK